ncbi:flavin reductase family protein [Streptomyces sp. SP2-10]|uniref:flavin reductase family protein n=1 Tax=Streptomyces sp. SP2-10 TaxID=2873385 RepID=UPI001CA74CEF|nr:flavin reductase family protein [Streptomyces sp. SP2-10]MBY8845355.1 flavin reductase family protein [Streptomyces sp. SP2-10]
MLDSQMSVVEPETFRDAMSSLASGVAVVTAAGLEGGPCGLLVSSLCSYSATPPSVLLAIDRRSRSCTPLLAAEEFGIHLLHAGQGAAAAAFASRADHKFAGQQWSWDGPVPRLADALVYLRCLRARVVEHGDHAVLIGDVTRCEAAPGEPLVYFRRALDWQLTAPDRP